jgi:murein DD-endopeptidase MepM/ murein hydrolase activator NlpD
MSKADDYNHAEIISGRLTMAEITALVKFFQMSRPSSEGLVADGMAGARTQAAINELLMPATAPATDAILKFLAAPMPTLGDGRKPVITSSFKHPKRLKHVGLDFFYLFKDGDKPDFVGDGGGAGDGKGSSPKWVVPFGVSALAAAAGKVQVAGKSATGFRLWIDHGNGLRSGYFHLSTLVVAIGQVVTVGQPLGLVGDNPADHDGRHLHFELSPVDRYAPMDPVPYLKL